MATDRYRMRFDFQLNVTKSDEHAIAEQITLLKQQGLYSKTVRDGIRLVSDLREGSLNVLFELFPWVRAEFLEYMTSVQPQKSETEVVISQQLARIEELLASDKPASPTAETQGRGMPKKMVVPSVPAPAFEDDTDLLVVSKAKSSGNASQNFLNSAFNLIR